MENLGNFPLLASFFAGILTFISPCVLPLIPAFISFITGVSIEDLTNSSKSLKQTLLKTAVFISGFSAVFILFGMSASWLGGLLGEYRSVLRYIGATVVIILGLHMTGIIRIKFLYRQVSASDKISSAAGWAGAFLVGAAFALGWTPCVGPILATILLVASSEGNVMKGFWLLVFYSLGLGIPFMITALSINRFLNFFNKIKKYYRAIEIISGVFLIIVGILLLTDGFTKITAFILQKFS